MGEITSVIAMRPVTFFILLTIGVLLLPSIVIPYWYDMMKKIEHDVEMEATYTRYQVASKIEDAGKFLFPVNSSANDLAGLLGSILDNKQHSFFDIETKVAPILFEALMVVPHSVQASYIGLDGLFFSYIIDEDKSYAVYSNSSYASNSSTSPYTWYIQPAKSDTGALYGEAKITNPVIVVKETWFQRAMESPSGYASLGSLWTSNVEEEHDLFLDTAKLGGTGAISLGFTVKGLANLFSGIDINAGRLYMATLDEGKVLLDGIKEAKIGISGGNALVHGGNNDIVGEIPCKPSNGATNGEGTILDIGGTSLIFYCSRIDIARVPSVYVLAFPSEGLVSKVHKHTQVALMLLILMMVAMVISIFAFVALIVRAARREVHLCSAYMRQMEKTAQAERKSMKQSLAFATANHDVRGYLACIKGLIELSCNDVSPSSELASNLRKIYDCAEDLLALVNSILDFSKIEAGKMQLEEGEFDLAQLLEDIADLHHAVSMKKGVEVILDPCDGSVMKFSRVRGDRGKFKQILSNLLSNAVKFTQQGHISIHAWAKKPSLENSIIASNKNNLLNRLSCLFFKNKRAYNDLEEMKTIKQDPNCMEFEFQVEDTGPGIPKDKRESIFENFVQVKENSAGQVGTGLGLGIVQSLVRLMGGDIEIVDKSDGERGTCFKFNIFMIVHESNCPVDNLQQDKLEYQDSYPSPGLSTCGRSPRAEGSIVVLLIKNDGRRRMLQRYMESLGLKLVVVKQINQLTRTLKKWVKPRLNVSKTHSSSSGKSDLSPPCGSLGGVYLSSSSDQCHSGPKLLPLSAMDGADDVLPVYKRPPSFRGLPKCVMLVIDANAGDFQELRRSVAEFRKDYYRTCIKVVWLEHPDTRRAHFPGLQDESLPPTDCIISEPLHGSRLTRVIGLLPEFGGQVLRVPSMRKRPNSVLSSNPQSETDELGSSSGDQRLSSKKRNWHLSCNDDGQRDVVLELENMTPKSRTKVSHGEIQEIASESSDKEKTSIRSFQNDPMIAKRFRGPQATEVQNTVGGPSSNKPLEGKKFLIAEDFPMLRKVAASFLTRLGANVEVCENGKEAVEIICEALSNLTGGRPSMFPYDYVLMDCQMPVMDGFEATRRIREEERRYSVHIPIIALTAHEASEEGQNIVEAGMDYHLTKPLRKEELLEAMRLVHGKFSFAEN